MSRPRRLPLAACALTLLGLGSGCASQGRLSEVSPPRRGTAAEAPQEPLAASPYAKPAGGREPAPDPGPRQVRFLAPDPLLQPSPSRPPLATPLRLALVTVRRGLVVRDGAALLALDDALGRDPAFAARVALPRGHAAAVTLEDLAARARREGYGLLLVDVRPGPGGLPREGLLVHPRTGTLLARYAVRHPTGSAAPPQAPDSAAEDPLARLAAAYARCR